MRIPLVIAAVTLLSAPFVPRRVAAQSEPFAVFDTKPVITHGPYLVDPTETAVTVVWMTDTPSHSEVRYGIGDAMIMRAEPAAPGGLLPVGTIHVVRISGLTPGKTYNYRAVSTRVVKLKAYWPDKGLSIETPVKSFTTLDRSKSSVSFSVITDTHENLPRVNALMTAIDWPTSEFLVHLGDAFDWVDSEDQIFAKWLDPVGKSLAGGKSMLYARGNHEWRGAFARELIRYVPTASGEFFSAVDHGPLHMLVLDSGEDKPDTTNVYSRLNRSEPYLARELDWIAAHAKETPRFASAPFRVVFVHQPQWGSMPNGNARWTALLNESGVDLVIAGHDHRHSRTNAGTNGARYTTLVIGTEQFAHVTATPQAISVVVRTSKGEPVDSFTVSRRK